MARGENAAFAEAEHIEHGYEDAGHSKADTGRLAWSAANHESAGGNMSDNAGSNRKGGEDRPQRPANSDRSSGTGGATRSREERSHAAKRGWTTRRSKDALK